MKFPPATQQFYIQADSRLAKYHKNRSDEFGKEKIWAFLADLTAERKLSPNCPTGYCSGLRVLYNETPADKRNSESRRGGHHDSHSYWGP